MNHAYCSAAYAQSWPGSMDPIEVPEWRCFVLKRSVPGTTHLDACGVYPLTLLDPGADIGGGLARLRDAELVSLVMVVDPVYRPGEGVLQQGFDFAKPFKTHYLQDNRRGRSDYSKHHRYELRKASADIRIIELKQYMAEWVALYADLVQRRNIAGAATFSRDAFCSLAAMPGLTCFGAFQNDTLVACHLWLDDGKVAHSHLAAASAAGYACGASYQLYDAAICHFSDVDIVNFGGGAGLEEDSRDGLSRLKRGFANSTAKSLICGAVLDEKRYRELSTAAELNSDTYFPAYRAGPSTVHGGPP